MIDVQGDTPQPLDVTCRFKKIRALVGVEPDGETARKIFESLDLQVIDLDTQTITVRVPSLRRDLTREVDLVEEYARMNGLDKIPAPLPHSEVVLGAEDSRYLQIRQLTETLAGLGLVETMNYSFTSARLLDQLDPDRKEQRIVLPNPLSGDHAVMRTSLIPQMVESLGRNRRHQVHTCAFFECGITYQQENETASEPEKLCLGLMGALGRHYTDLAPITAEEMYYQGKGILEALIHGAFEIEPGGSIDLCARSIGCHSLARSAGG